MAEITVITAALAGIKHATDLVRLLRESNTSLEQAEQKFKLADLIETLAETRMRLAEIQEVLLEKDQKIKDLEDAFQSNSSLIKVNDAYYEVDLLGVTSGEAYCMHCWEANHKKYHLHHFHTNATQNICPSCKTVYATHIGRYF
jgi:hypothetical protein